MKKKYLFLFVIFIISVYAKLDIESEIIDNSIYLDEVALYKLKITNPDSIEKTIQIYSTDVQWQSQIEPFIGKIGPSSENEINLKLIPTAWAQIGTKIVSIFVETSANDKYQLQFPVYVKSFDAVEKEYTPSVELQYDFPDTIDPREIIPLKIYLRNRNKLDIKEMEIIIKTTHFSDTKIIALPPLSETRDNLVFKIDDLTPPSRDMLEIILRIGNKTINSARKFYDINSYGELLVRDEKIKELFKKRIEYTLKNEGNIEKTYSFKYPISIFNKIFVSSSQKPIRVNLMKDGYLEWEFTLKPREEIKLYVTENYRPIIYFVLLSMFAIMLYFMYRSPIVIKKEAILTGKPKDGISELKVLLHIRNRSQEIVENISVSDTIPLLAELVKETHIGTLAPSKIIKNDKKGTIIKWEIEAIEPFEERIISYRVTSKIAVVGGLKLPPAKVKFLNKDRERKIKSNSADVSFY